MLSNEREIGRGRRRKRVRKEVQGTDWRPRLCVFRSLKHIYAQVISDESGKTLVSVSTLSKQVRDGLKKNKGVGAAKQIGLKVAQACKEKNIRAVVFDRNGFLYHGRVKAIAEGARIGDGLIPAQGEVRLHGHAMQCRITTEDPEQNFIPDYGRITAYRGATGFGIRLDGGTAYSGAVITRFYDPLLEKVTAWAPSAEEAAQRMDRAFRIPGIGLRVGWDSIAGLVPGIGDALSLAPAGYILYSGYQLGASAGTLARMAIAAAMTSWN